MPGDPVRAILRKRALRGHWNEFPVSPARIDVRLSLVPGGHPNIRQRWDWLTSGSDLDARWTDLTRVTVELEPAVRLAVHRACLSLLAELSEEYPWDKFERGPSQLRADAFTKYFEVPWSQTGIRLETYLRDILDFLVWWDEDDMAFAWELFKEIPRQDGDRVAAVFRDALTELRRHGFGAAIGDLLEIWASFLATHQRFDDFVPLAHAIGPSAVHTVFMLAQIAQEQATEELALEIFTAANQPGPGQCEVEDACRHMLHRDPLPRLGALRPL